MHARNLTLAFALGAPFACVLAQSSEILTLTAECTTEGTGANGEQYACDSAPATISALRGFVFSIDTVSVEETSGGGAEHSCHIGWQDWVQVNPVSPTTQPRTMTLRAHAKSPQGLLAGRGWAKCKATALLSRYFPPRDPAQPRSASPQATP